MAYKKLQSQLRIGTPKVVSRDSGVRLQVGEPVEVSRLHGEGTFPQRFPEVDLAAEVDRQQLEAGQRLVRENDAERLDDLAMSLAAQPPAKQGPDFSAMPRRYKPIDVPKLQRMLSPEGQTPASGGPEYSPEDLGLKTFDGVSDAEIARRAAAKQAGKPLDAPRAPRVSVGFASEAERPASVEAARRGESLVPAPRAPQLSVPPTAAEPQESDMDRAERTDRLRALMAQLAGAGQLAIGRDASIGQQAVMSQPGAVESLLRRRSLAEVEGAKDPNSDASKKAREKLRGALPGLAKRLGPALDRMTAADLAKFDVLGESVDMEKSAAKAAADATAREQGRIEQEKLWQQHNAITNAQNRSNMLAAAAIQRGESERKQGISEAADLKKLALPGYVLTGEVMPTEIEARNLRQAQAARRALQDDINRLRDIKLGKVGPSGQREDGEGMIVGPQFTEAGQKSKAAVESTEASILKKMKEMDTLGALDAGVLALAAKQIPGGSTRAATAGTMLDELERQLDSGLESKRRAMGYAPATAAAPAPASPAAPKQAPSGAVRMLDPGGKVRLVPASQVEAAKKAGGKVL